MTVVQRRPPKSAAVVYAILTAVLVAIIASVAIVVRASSTPAIAEFGPSAQDKIQDARADQSRAAGDNSRGGAGDRNCAGAQLGQQGCDPNAANGQGSTTTTRPTVEVAAGRRCYGQPPRQTEDPHSPPCKFEIFHGDNGGGTSSGVTGSEIKVAFPLTSADNGQEETINSLVNHFNQRYEFYGRRISPVFVVGWPFDNAANNEATADALVGTGAFAVATGTLYWNANASIHRRLASKNIISVVGQQVAFGTKDMVEGRTWTVDPPMDQRLRTGGRFVCQDLKGKNAIHAGAEYQNSPRKFAIVVLEEQAGGPDSGPLEDTLRACSAGYKVFRLPYWSTAADFTTLANQLHTDGYTTVLPVSPYVQGSLYSGATRAQYYPEWVDFGIAGVHLEYTWGGPGQSDTVGHAAHAFGVVGEFSVRPGVDDVRAMAAWREGGAKGDGNADPWYDPLLVIAAGIQGAGPHLTPDTFADALRTMRFPNPNSGAPPYWQPGIGFGRGDPSFRNDYAIWWWSANADAEQTVVGSSGKGSFCYVDRGARFTAETFPLDADSLIDNPSVPCR
jgi:hypothetical protein